MIKARASIVVSAALLATGSGAIQRHGPDQAVYCSLEKSRDGYDILCPKPVLNGGWPAPFAFDQPGMSVEDKIAFLEDDFRVGPFFGDIPSYILILLIVRRTLR